MSAPFMQLYVADYMADTRHLTCEQDGAYMRLLMAMWRSGGTLPNDPGKLARITGLSVTRWDKVGADVMAFFDEENGLLTQKRLTKEIQKAEEKSSKRSEAGKSGVKAKAMKNNEMPKAIAETLPKHSLEPELELDIIPPIVPQGDELEKEVFEAAWKAFPHCKGRSIKNKSLAAFKQLPNFGRTQFLRIVQDYSASLSRRDADFVPAFERWIRDGRWRDFTAEPEVPKTDNDIWVPRLKIFADKGVWLDKWGERPGRDGCEVPTNLLTAHVPTADILPFPQQELAI